MTLLVFVFVFCNLDWDYEMKTNEKKQQCGVWQEEVNKYNRWKYVKVKTIVQYLYLLRQQVFKWRYIFHPKERSENNLSDRVIIYTYNIMYLLCKFFIYVYIYLKCVLLRILKYFQGYKYI